MSAGPHLSLYGSVAGDMGRDGDNYPPGCVSLVDGFNDEYGGVQSVDQAIVMFSETETDFGHFRLSTSTPLYSSVVGAWQDGQGDCSTRRSRIPLKKPSSPPTNTHK